MSSFWQILTFKCQFSGGSATNHTSTFHRLFIPSARNGMKAFSQLGQKQWHTWWRTPYLDIYFYNEDDTHILLEHGEKHKKTDTFPLLNRPFGNRMRPCPRDPRAFLKSTYLRYGQFNMEAMCYTHYYDYMQTKEKPKEDMNMLVPCASLLNYFPFVQHSRGPGSAYCKEELVFKGEVLSTFVRSARNISVC